MCETRPARRRRRWDPARCGPRSTSVPSATTRRSWRGSPPRPRCVPWSRRTPTGTGRSRWPEPPWRAAPPGWRWPLPKKAVELRGRGPLRTRARAVGTARPMPWPTSSPTGSRSTLYTRAGIRAAAEASAPRRRRHRRPCQGRHGDAPGRRGAAPSWARSSRPLRPSRPCASPPCGRISRWPTASRTRTGPSPRNRSEVSVRPVTLWRTPGTRPPMLHAANSAGALAYPASRLDLVRCGIALYGVPPFPVVDPVVADVVASTPGRSALRPVLSLRAKVTLVRRLDADRASLLRPSLLAGHTLDGGHRAPRLCRRRAPALLHRTAVRCWWAVDAVPWPGWSRWTRSWSTAAPPRMWRWVTTWC